MNPAEPNGSQGPQQSGDDQLPTQPPSWTGELNTLAQSVDGPVLTPGMEGYDEEVAVFNQSVSHHPALVVGAASPGDVSAAVRFANVHRLGVAVLNTGHGPSVGATDEILLITTRRMSDIAIDAERRTARVQAGVRFGPLVEQAARYGLAPSPAPRPASA